MVSPLPRHRKIDGERHSPSTRLAVGLVDGSVDSLAIFSDVDGEAALRPSRFVVVESARN